MDNLQNAIIDGELFEKIVVNGALNLKANIKIVNDLNVFPIPDGDTGDNMFMTINGGVPFLKNENAKSISAKSEALANGMLLNARGNSGVILSQLFNGMAKGFNGLEKADVKQLGIAFKRGVEQAYSAVVQPVEGTILTVAREAAQYAIDHTDENSTLLSFMKDYLQEMRASLERTPDLLEALKEAGVIDSGGAGLLYIMEGMNDALGGKEIEDTEAFTQTAHQLDFSKFTEDSVMEFGYCTEYLLQLQKCKVNLETFTVDPIIKYLETIGDSIVCFQTGTIVKVHVHTLTPYKALEFCQQFGEFLTIKIENMTLQHNEVVKQKEQETSSVVAKRKRARRSHALVTVATGEGLINTFKELGADEVIDGGQGKNPSIERFIEAFDDVNADNIYVLPNNSNIIMAASQAAEIYKDSKIWVIKSKNFGQAYSALSMLDYSSDNAEEIAKQIESDMQNVVTGMITKSIRDANINGVDIKENDYIGFTDKTMHVANKEKLDTYMELLEKLDASDKSFLINVYGGDVTYEEKVKINEFVNKNYPNIECYEIEGNQEVYDFIIILE